MTQYYVLLLCFYFPSFLERIVFLLFIYVHGFFLPFYCSMRLNNLPQRIINHALVFIRPFCCCYFLFNPSLITLLLSRRPIRISLYKCGVRFVYILPPFMGYVVGFYSSRLIISLIHCLLSHLSGIGCM